MTQRTALLAMAGVGDLVFALPAVDALARAGHRVTLVTRPPLAGLARRAFGANDVFVWDKRGVDASPLGTLRAARRLAERVGYVSAGTMEFLVDKEGNFYFIEMNTRIQVEHPVTEMITGIDLVQAQFRIAQGEKLWLKQEEIQVRGHAIEVRVNAEDPEKGFRPSIGKVETLLFPGGPGVRVDSHLYTGYQIPPHYDSLIAKIIVWAPTREEAIRRMERALSETVIEGPGLKTTIPFHQKVLQNAFFRRGAVYTNFVARRMEM